MNAVALMQQLQADGFSVAVVDGADLVVAPADRLTDGLRTAIRANKEALLDLIAGGYPACGICPRCRKFCWRPAHSPNIGWTCAPCRASTRRAASPLHEREGAALAEGHRDRPT
jgi:hypothetical protein